MLTQKDFKAVVEIINRCSGLDVYWKYQTIYTRDLVCSLADYFATQNPRFDRDRFMKACGLTE